MTAVGIIVGLVMLVASAGQTDSMMNTVTLANQSTDAAVADATAFYVTGYKSLSSVVIYNETGDAIVGATNYTVTNNVVYNGQEAVKITPATVPNAYNYKWLISGVAQPLGYADSTTRSIVPLIVIFGALAIAVVALVPALRSGVVDFIKN